MYQESNIQDTNFLHTSRRCFRGVSLSDLAFWAYVFTISCLLTYVLVCTCSVALVFVSLDKLSNDNKQKQTGVATIYHVSVRCTKPSNQATDGHDQIRSDTLAGAREILSRARAVNSLGPPIHASPADRALCARCEVLRSLDRGPAHGMSAALGLASAQDWALTPPKQSVAVPDPD